MRLLVIAPDIPNEDDETPGGIFVKEQTLDLSNHFEEIHILVPKPITFGRYPEIDRMKNYSIGNVHIYYPKFLYFPIPWFKRNIRKLYLNSILKTVKRSNIHFDVVWAHFTNYPGVTSLIIKKKFEVPMILTIHENSEWFNREIDSNDAQLIEVWKGADLILRSKRDDLDKLKQYNSNVYCVPIGYNNYLFRHMEKEEARLLLGISSTRPILFSLGSLIKRKGYDHLIRAIKILIDDGLILDCYIAGSGEESHILCEMVSNLGLDEYIHFLGRISNSDKNLWMNCADLFVLSSLSESFGLVQLEAMACGTPVVATRNGGSENIINDNVGVLCVPGNPHDLAIKIDAALRKTWEYDTIIQYALQYDWESINKLIMALIYKMEKIKVKL